MFGLLLFTSSVAMFMYSKQSKLSKNAQENIEVYVSTKNLHKGDLISANDIRKSVISKNYVNFTPLMETEIIGRYVKVDMFVNEVFRKEKLSMSKPVEKSTKIEKTVEIKKEEIQELKKTDSDTMVVSLVLFRNIDNSLKAGDYIDIVSVLPKKSKSREYSFTTKYVALHIPIHSFISNSKSINSYLRKVDDKYVEADSVVFEMSPKDIKNFLALYYKTQELNANRVYNNKTNNGHFWMVKCSTQINESLQKEKKHMLLNRVVHKVKRKKYVEKASISYEK
jgi:hypothetical protein